MQFNDINIKSIETLLSQIIDKSNIIKAKNNNHIEQINHDFNTFLDLGRKLIQTCISDKITLIKELDILQTACKDLNGLINSTSKNCTKCPPNCKPHMKIENLFENSDVDENDNKFIKKEKVEKLNVPEVCIPDTCMPDTCFTEVNDNDTKKKQQLINEVIKETVEVDFESTPKAIKKLLNEHGLDDLTNSPTVINKDLVDTTNTSAKKNDNDKYDNLIDKILKNESFDKSANLNDSLNYSLDFKKTTSIVQQQQQQSTKLKKLKSNEKLVNQQALQASPGAAGNNKKKFKQITMTQAFDNCRYNSQSKENLPTTATTTTTLSSANSSSKLNTIGGAKSNKFLVDSNRENGNTNNKYLDHEDDLFLLDSNDRKGANKLNRLNSTNSNLNDENDIDLNDDDDDDLIFNFEKPPKKKTNSPNFKHVQVVKKQNERKKLNAFACKECENYWKSLPEELRTTRMQDICRHRAKYEAPATPEDYWSIRFPNTQECIEKGYGGVVVEPDTEGPKRARRKRPLKLIQRNSDEDTDFP